MAQWSDAKYAQLTALLGNLEFLVRDDGEISITNQIKRLIGLHFLTQSLTPAQITADQNNYNPTGLASSSVLRLSTDASRNITGLQGGIKDRMLAIANVASFNIVLQSENASSTAANRFALDANLTLAAAQACILWYDITSSRWRCIAKTSAAAAVYPGQFDRLTRITGGASGARTTVVVTPSGETININVAGNLRVVPPNTSLDVNTAANWISTTYATAANRSGLQFKIYAIENGGASAPKIQFDLHSNAAPANSRLIGGFHCLCVAVGAIAGHTLTNYVAGDILPQSVWDLKFMPRRHPDGTYREGFVYDSQDGIWKGIYLVNTSYLSKYNTPKLVSVNWMDICDYLGSVGARLLRDREFQLGAAGSNEGTNIAGSTDTPNTGGNIDTAGKRMISNIGLEDCCGLIWQWLDEQSFQYASTTAFGYVNQTGGKGQLNLQGATADVKLIAGGGWAAGANSGSRSRNAADYRWATNTNLGGRAGVEPGE